MSILALGMATSLFLAISYVICVVGYFLLPASPITHSALAVFLPGFSFETISGLAIGLLESLAWGWYVALVLGSLYNFFVARFALPSS